MPIRGNKIIGTVAYMGGLPAVLESFTWSWTQMMQYNAEYLQGPGEIVNYDRSTISYHSAARNGLVDRMQGDWLVMFDTDHAFEPDIVGRLLRLANYHNVDVITALYVNRNPPHPPVIFLFDQDSMLFNPVAKWDKNGAELVQIGSAGAGTLFVRRKVFERIRTECKEEPFAPKRNYGEDHSFFYRLLNLDIPAYFAPMIESYHLMVKPLSIDSFEVGNLRLKERQEVGGLACQ